MTESHTNAVTYTCRSACAEDAPTLAAFNLAMALETEGLALEPATVRKGVDAVFADTSLAHYFVAEHAGRVVGQLMITYEWSDWRNAHIWWIQSVYVHPDHRRRGVFRQLYHHVQKQAQAAGNVAAIRLYVERDNTAAQRVYADLGFTDTHYQVYESRTETNNQ
ncbi:MAG: GNAT family N-acetyltransferase [Phycisphaeraceae bacterium]